MTDTIRHISVENQGFGREISPLPNPWENKYSMKKVILLWAKNMVKNKP